MMRHFRIIAEAQMDMCVAYLPHDGVVSSTRRTYDGPTIETAVNDEEMRRRTAELGMWIQAKDGVVRAVDMVAQVEAGDYAQRTGDARPHSGHCSAG